LDMLQWVVFLANTESLYSQDGVGSWGKDEEDWNSW
jgi:hypothetical protein